VETHTSEEASEQLPPEETVPTEAAEASEQLPVLVDEGKPEDAPPTDPLDQLGSDVLDDLSAEDLDALASGDPAAIARILGEEAPAEDQPRNAEEADTQSQAEEGEEPPEAEATESGPTRVSLKSLPVEDRKKTATAVTLVRDGVYENLAEALADVYGLNRQSAQSSTETAEGSDAEDSESEETVAEELPEAVAEIQSRIDQLVEERKTALSEFETDKAIEIGDQIAELRLEAFVAKQQAEAQAQSQEQLAQEEATYIDKARDQYPDLLDEESTFFEEAIRERAYREATDPDFFDKPDWPLRLAETVNERIGGAKPTATTQETTYANQGKAPPARPPGQVATGGNGMPVLSAEDAMAKIEAGEVDAESILEELTRREMSVA